MHLPRSFKGVTVEVISEGEPLEFYDDPDEDPNDKRDLQRYIEAVTDAVFKVRVTLSTKFSLYSLGHDDAVRLSINYDGQPLDWYTDLSTKEIRRSWGSGQVAAHTFACVSRYCNDSQQWFRADTTFGALTTSRFPLIPSERKSISNRLDRRHGSFSRPIKRPWQYTGEDSPRLQDEASFTSVYEPR